MSTVATETTPAEGPAGALQPIWRRALAFGTGLGIAIGDRHLDVAVVRARPSGATLLATATVEDFRTRPAAEWGAEIQRLVAAAGGSRLAATLLLPRSEVIVRTVSLPGVAAKDVVSAVELQTDTLHPWGDVDVVWDWSAAGSKGDVMVGLARKELLDSFETLFSEAGIPVAAATFSSAVIHAALRIWSATPASLLLFTRDENGRTEVYGESEARAVFSAEFPVPLERAIALARAELRMHSDTPARPLAGALPVNGEPALACAAALAGAASRVTTFANLLPPERRAAHDRMQYVVPSVLAALVVIALVIVFVVFPSIEQRRYRNDLDHAARQLEPAALRAQSAEKKTAAARTRIAALDEIRRRPQADLDVLNELTRLLPPPVWTSSIEIFPDSVVVSGEADQAAPLLKVLDSSPLFQNSEFALSVTRNAQTEVFRIKSMRRGRAGRTTP
jgi:Tfp pilus assembly protein PilN